MEMNSSYHKLVYEYYESRILYGYYRYGESLPSICKICGIFSMAPATVRVALALLEKRGYIRMEARKVARVVYEADPNQFRRNAAEYFVPRKEGIKDLFESGRLLFVPAWEKGLRRWEEQDWEILREGLTRPRSNAVSMPVEFYILCLNTFHNSLLINLFWEAIRYIRFPYLADEKEKVLVARKLEGKSKDEIIDFLKGKIHVDFQAEVSGLLEYIDEARAAYQLEDAEPVSFRWNIYRQRPQLRYTLASKIMLEIIHGKYPRQTFLPSLPVMAQEYQVSLNTVRRTIEILGSLGIVRSLHGKGTLVCMEPRRGEYNKPDVEEGLRLYLESLEILALTIRQVLLYTLEHVSREVRTALAMNFRKLSREKKSYRGFEEILAFVEENCPLYIVKECYRKLRELLVWGYPLAILRLEEEDLHMEYAERIAWAGDQIYSERLQEFSLSWMELMEEENRKVRWLLKELKQGNLPRKEGRLP